MTVTYAAGVLLTQLCLPRCAFSWVHRHARCCASRLARHGSAQRESHPNGLLRSVEVMSSTCHRLGSLSIKERVPLTSWI